MYADPVPRLIMVEGTIGSGKTTTASRIHRFLKGHHIASELFLEGDIHNPADFEHCYRDGPPTARRWRS